ncbi:putative uncharacterized protein C5orf58 homolog [Hemicordylus capensis]|uniref:putative uncharacterized protein C5orf58 homolog n=1 Tax=Hemicordylus capensis TaxID=884348 RepID=UPI00230305C6|nr:putative uncharacterized protein C5orf58 homolog [Hemicordylus capensis]
MASKMRKWRESSRETGKGMSTSGDDDGDQQFTIGIAIKNMDKMSCELNKLIVKSQLLLCDLTLNFSHPVQSDVSKEAEEKNHNFEDLRIKLTSSIYCPFALASLQ